LVDDHQSLAGIIEVPTLRERYIAINGHGATLNDQQIHVRQTDQLIDAMVAIGDYTVSARAANIRPLQLAITRYLATGAQRVRMVGSAAIDLAWLASGRFDATIMLSNKPWDTPLALSSHAKQEPRSWIATAHRTPFSPQPPSPLHRRYCHKFFNSSPTRHQRQHQTRSLTSLETDWLHLCDAP
jgi:myo-inositol-1(or 4)-monophosphatase